MIKYLKKKIKERRDIKIRTKLALRLSEPRTNLEALFKFIITGHFE